MLKTPRRRPTSTRPDPTHLVCRALGRLPGGAGRRRGALAGAEAVLEGAAGAVVVDAAREVGGGALPVAVGGLGGR